MSVIKRGRLSLVRLALGLGIMAIFPFVAAGGASAAIGLGQAPNLAGRPDLLSVHLLGGANGGRAEFCFDKQVANGSDPDGYSLQGYRWDTVLYSSGSSSTALDSSTSTCSAGGANSGVQVDFPGVDLSQYTIGEVSSGIVTANQNNGQTNLGDSAPLVESASASGTRGVTSGPDLKAVTFGGSAQANELIYVFDQAVNPASINATNFGYTDTAGKEYFGLAGSQAVSSSAPNAVRISFNQSTSTLGGTPTTSNTTNAVQAFVYHGSSAGPGDQPPNANVGAAFDASPGPDTWAPTQSVAPTGPNGPVGAGPFVRPALVSNEESGSNTMDFVFDQNVSLCGGPVQATITTCATSSLNTAAGPDFFAVASNGDEIQGSSATVLGDGKTVRVTFTQNLNNYLEEIVAGSVSANAVTTSNGGQTNLPGGKAAGTNVGKSAGYTNGPDANSVVFHANSGTATVTFDQRIATNGTDGSPVGPDGTTTTAAGLNGWSLLDQNGNLLEHPNSATVQNTGYTSTVTLTFSTPSLLNSNVARALEIQGNENAEPGSYSSSNAASPGNSNGYPGSPTSTVFTFGNQHSTLNSGFNAAGNVQQILAPTYASALVAQVKHAHFTTVHRAAKKSKHVKHTKHTKHTKHSAKRHH